MVKLKKTMIRLSEQGALVESKGRNGVYPVRIITEGVGSSAVYTRPLLEKYKDVFANKPMYMGHPRDASKPWDRPLTDMAGRTSHVIEAKEVNGVYGLYTEATVDSRWQPFFEDHAPHGHIDVSVFVAGESLNDDTETGLPIVESLDGGYPYNSVDFVAAGGRGGKVLTAMESYREELQKPGSDEQEKKARKLMEKEIQDYLDGALKPVLDFIATETAKAQKNAESEENKVTVEQAVANFAAASKTIAEANLFPSQVESLTSKAAKGEDITEALAEAIKVRDEAGTAAYSEGRVTESGNGTEDFTIGRMFS